MPIIPPQNGERIVAIDSVTSIHPMYIQIFNRTGQLRDTFCIIAPNYVIIGFSK